MPGLASNGHDTRSRQVGTVVVVGAGVAGIRASLDLAQVGCQVILVDASPAIGGLLQKLDHQFPNSHCGMCRMLPEVGREVSSRYCMRRGLFHDNITILPMTTVTEVHGEAGQFQVTLRIRSSWVDGERCGNCPSPCMQACPINVPDEFNQGLTIRKAIHRSVPQSSLSSPCIDRQACTRCGECVDVCPAGAIMLDAPDTSEVIEADAIIVALGASLYSPRQEVASAHLTTSPNVVTALELERILGIAGPRRRQLLRPSDGRPVRRIAWIQCVGSRDSKHDLHDCSSVCCMFALKEAMLVRAIADGAIDATIYYMDIRGFGKDFDRYRRRAEDEGVRFVRSRVHDIVATEDGGLRVRQLGIGAQSIASETYDMVVLSTGQRPHENLRQLGDVLGWPPSQDGWAPTQELDKTNSPVPGVYYCGSVVGPTDIGESIVSATAAASEAHKLVASRGRSAIETDPSRQRDRRVSSDDAGVLALTCSCHLDSMRCELNFNDLRDRLGVDVLQVARACTPEGLSEVVDALHGPHDRVAIGACSQHAAKRTFHRVAAETGIDSALVRVVDTGASSLPLEMAIAELRSADDAPSAIAPVHPAALIVGGGLAGMRAAVSLAERGIEVHLVEREDDLGGRLLVDDDNETSVQRMARSLCRSVRDHQRIHVHCAAEVEASTVSPGRRDTVIRSGASTKVISHGATILATGGRGARTGAYGHGTSDRIVTQWELERLLREGELDGRDLDVVVMIQCVESRDSDAHAYCSRICCMKALDNAQRLRAVNPDLRVLVLYRDMMTVGRGERELTRARSEGVLFSTYSKTNRPEVVLVDGRPVVTVVDPVVGRPLKAVADLLVLSTAVEPDAENVALARTFGLEHNADGFFVEADAKWRPLDFAADGVFVAGTAHAPQPAREVLTQAEAAAHRAFTRLTTEVVTSTNAFAEMHHALCSRCGACIEACRYHARSLDVAENQVVVDPTGCRACGTCTTTCPNYATRLGTMGQRQVMAALDVALRDITMTGGGSS